MEDMNHSQPPLTQEELHTLRIRIRDMQFDQSEQGFAISETFFDGREAYRGSDVNGPLFEGDSPLGGKLKEGLRFREHYLVINEDLLEEIQKRYACAKIRVGRSPKHSERWTIYKKKISYCVLQVQKMFNFGENERLTEKHVEVFAYYNTEDIKAAILRNQQYTEQFLGKLWIYPEKLPQRCLQLRTSLSDKTVIPVSMLNNDPELYKLQRKFKKQFTFLVEMEGPNIVDEPKFKCYHHPEKLAKYICICMNERSFACDQKCIDSSSKHKKRCIYVPRISLYQRYAEKEIDWSRPRQSGLYNQKNMCFFNTIVQCLAHIDRLSKYFLRIKERDELNYWNCDGTHGQVALEYGKFIREHWQGKYQKCNMALFQVVGRWNPSYANKHQQDSHEFLIRMLDWLKEDLNLNECKPAYKYIETQNKDEEELAKETQQILRARNFSIIQQLLQGLQKSVIKCITCGASSSTFDSFMTVQLPMSSERKVEICKNSCSVFLILEWNRSKIKRFQLYYDKDTTINDLKTFVKTTIENNDFEIDFYRAGKQGKVQILNNINMHDHLAREEKDQVIFCVEKYRKGQRGDSVQVKLVFQSSDPVPFSRPIYLPPVLEVQQIYMRMTSYFFTCLANDQIKNLQNYFAKTFETPSFPFDLVIRKPNGEQTEVKRVKTYDKYYFQSQSSLIVKVRHNKDFYFGKLNIYTTVNNPHDPKKKMMLIQPSIEDCLKMYCKKEMIKDKWECPKCKTKRDAAKTLYFHRLPNILILSLNRFKEIYDTSSVNPQFQKNQSQIRFKNILNMGEFTESQVRQEYRLTAVACHIRLNDYLRDVQQMDGHYYAHIRTKQGWLRFDDTDVLTISEEKVLDDRSAYILFYEKM